MKGFWILSNWSIYVHVVVLASTFCLTLHFGYGLLFHLCEGLYNISVILLNTYSIFGICLALHFKSENDRTPSVYESFLGESDNFFFT